MRLRRGESASGQTLVELALIAPLLFMVVFGIVILGIGVFYQQQVTNAARESARFAAIHTATAQCPTASNRDPRLGSAGAYVPLTYVACDRPGEGWPKMTAHARERLFGIDGASVLVSACWSGYHDATTTPASYDAPPPGEYTIGLGTVTYATAWAQCRIDGQDPTASPDQIRCTTSLPTTDEASNMSEKEGVPIGNRVTAYACYEWRPPLAGFLLIPPSIKLQAVITEPLERQQ